MATTSDEMPDPSHDLSPWIDLARQHPHVWHSKVCNAMRQRHEAHMRHITAGADAVPLVPSPSEPSHVCPLCERTFRTHAGLCAHAYRVHAQRSAAIQYAPSHGTCSACRMQFHTRARLVQHLMRG
eukprot:15482047-Alexandrium_andersonii.AAC.1